MGTVVFSFNYFYKHALPKRLGKRSNMPWSKPRRLGTTASHLNYCPCFIVFSWQFHDFINV